MRSAIVLVLPLLAACVTSPIPAPTRPPPQGSVGRPATPPPQVVRPAPSSGAFRAPRVMAMPGLEGVIGKNETALANIFGPPRLSVKEGDARKLQFAGEACVLDVFLYPLAPKAEPSATYVDARRASDGLDVDRAACVAALRRR
ncbi:hypothetical protein [Erythrobacter mangrovi]|uniref:DUF3035 domain-containing protein n=1 Tax=Erythrobacter mangrovi TaxID=2739433 RepID=A0A7D3XAU6_9SPHN|nr:hypothetical protein [Erythrobacter mangrovi]QKG70860.1 hypothetical protein HQR01_05450 [Erythrobacter mangrovi]